VARLSTLNGSTDDASSVMRDPGSGGDWPPVVILDRSAFNRNCIAASLMPHRLPELFTFDSVADVPQGIEDPITVFSASGAEGAVLESELHAAQQRWPTGTRVLLLSHADGWAGEMMPVRLASLNAILADDLPADVLVAALRLAHQDHVVVPRRLLSGAFSRIMVNEAMLDRIATDHPLLANSTGRQRQVMQFLVIGLSNKAIAKRLAISESTVKAHIRAIMDMLGAANRTQIVARLMRLQDDTAAHSDEGESE
jgi:DNA-binding NarL/FixJ family response regulator